MIQIKIGVTDGIMKSKYNINTYQNEKKKIYHKQFIIRF